MQQPDLDVVGIGNAIVDVIFHTDDAFLNQHGMAKGGMMLIDEEAAERLYGQAGPSTQVSGGSAANTIAGIASLGGSAGYIGMVRNDVLGQVFAHDMRSAGIVYETPFAQDGAASARCLIFVTPDAQRTMNTYLGACRELGPEHIDVGLIERARVTYLEGYLFDPPHAQEAFRKAARIASRAGREVALSLSDAFCVERHREAFLDLVEHHIDILFANEGEICALFEVAALDEALDRLQPMVRTAAITCGANGSILMRGERREAVAPVPVAHVVDTTGAGDLYAAGFLFGHVRGRDLRECGHLGSLAAAEIISHFGGRPETPLRDYAVIATA